MALSATFTANFDSFFKAVEQADKAMQGFTATVNKTNKDLAAVSTDAPKNLQKITTETQKVDKATIDWMGSLTKVAGAIGIAFTLDAVAGFVGSVFDAASAVKDLSDQWGISTKAVQQWTGAFKQSGVEATTVGKSIQFLTGKLAEGSTAYQALLDNVGLSYEELRKMPLEEAYEHVITAIAGIKDETLQLDVAQGLLGDDARKLIGGIRDDVVKLKDAQDFMADETVRRLTAAQTTWKGYWDTIVIGSAEAMNKAGKDLETWGEKFTRWYAAANRAVLQLIDATGDLDKTGQAFLASQDQMGDSVRQTGKDIQLTTVATVAANKETRTTAEILKDVTDKEAARKRALQDSERALTEAKREQDAYNKSITDLQKAFAGGGLIDKANLYLKALSESIPMQKMTRAQQDDINKTMVAALEVYEAVGETAPQGDV